MKLLEMLFPLGKLMFKMFADDDGAGGDGDKKGIGDEGFDHDAEVTKRGSKVVLLENKRKGEDLTAANKRIKELESDKSTRQDPLPKPKPTGEPDYIKELRATGEEEGLSKKYVDAQIRAIGRMTTDVSTHVVDASTRQRTGFTKNMDKLANDDEYKFVMSKYGKEVGDYVQSEFPAAVWGDKKVFESALGVIINKHRKELYGKGSSHNNTPPNETGESGGDNNDKSYGGIPRAVLEKYAVSMGYRDGELSNDVIIRKKVIDAYKSKKAYLDAQNDD